MKQIMFLLSESLFCHNTLGMQDGSIADFQINASSENPSFPARNGRPYYSGWCSAPTDLDPYFQVLLYKYILKEMYTLSRETTMSVLFCLPLERGLLPKERICSLVKCWKFYSVHQVCLKA